MVAVETGTVASAAIEPLCDYIARPWASDPARFRPSQTAVTTGRSYRYIAVIFSNTEDATNRQSPCRPVITSGSPAERRPEISEKNVPKNHRTYPLRIEHLDSTSECSLHVVVLHSCRTPLARRSNGPNTRIRRALPVYYRVQSGAEPSPIGARIATKHRICGRESDGNQFFHIVHRCRTLTVELRGGARVPKRGDWPCVRPCIGRRTTVGSAGVRSKRV